MFHVGKLHGISYNFTAHPAFEKGDWTRWPKKSLEPPWFSKASGASHGQPDAGPDGPPFHSASQLLCTPFKYHTGSQNCASLSMQGKPQYWIHCEVFSLGMKACNEATLSMWRLWLNSFLRLVWRKLNFPLLVIYSFVLQRFPFFLWMESMG